MDNDDFIDFETNLNISASYFRDISQVNMAKDMGLIIFCWGDDNNSKDTIKFLKDNGLHAIIYDKVDVLIENKVRIQSFSTIPVYHVNCS